MVVEPHFCFRGIKKDGIFTFFFNILYLTKTRLAYFFLMLLRILFETICPFFLSCSYTITSQQRNSTCGITIRAKKKKKK